YLRRLIAVEEILGIDGHGIDPPSVGEDAPLGARPSVDDPLLWRSAEVDVDPERLPAFAFRRGVDRVHDGHRELPVHVDVLDALGVKPSALTGDRDRLAKASRADGVKSNVVHLRSSLLGKTPLRGVGQARAR